MSGGHDNAVTKCGLFELILFVVAIISGTACSLCSKTMMELKGEGIDGDIELFQKPIFQTFGMFVGMVFGIVMHWVVIAFKIPFPGYEHLTRESDAGSQADGAAVSYGSITNEKDSLLQKIDKKQTANEGLPLWMYAFLGIPSFFDLAATVLCMMGLQYIDVSIYQLLRGSGIIFVALMKQYVLKDKLFTFQWVGVTWNVISVVLVGYTAVLNEQDQTASVEDEDVPTSHAFLGVLFVMAGAIVQAMQFAFEEKVMTMDIPSPPLLLIGMEGIWGTLLCIFVVYPIAYWYPGEDHGSYEDPFNTLYMILHSSTIQYAFVVYFFAIFLYNLFAVLVTFKLNSVWHAILDNFRPITVWGTDLFIFYAVTSSGDFGEPWTRWGYLQLFGMFVLLYGTAVYNAPNAGSIRLQGEWYSFGMDFRSEYQKVEASHEDEQLHEEWEERMSKFKKRSNSSFYGDHSPHVSVHTQALRGLASPKI